MKKNRLALYALLMLPVVGFGGYVVTRPAAERSTLLSEFKHKTLGLFRGEPDGPIEGLRSTGEFAAEYAAGGADAEGAGASAEEDNTQNAADATDADDQQPLDPTLMFAELDSDHDGQLTGAELPEQMQGELAEIDGDGDGKVTKEEFAAFLSNRRADN